MCVRSCLCNSCAKKKTCSDCIYINDIGVKNWNDCCYKTGITKCTYYLDFHERNVSLTKGIRNEVME